MEKFRKRYSSGIIISVILGTFFIMLSNGCASREVPMEKDIYSFTAKSIDNRNIALNQYRGKVVLIVNTASNCGFTSQYAGLQELYDKYKDRGFTVLGFPCNQFGGQEPGNSSTIKNFCRVNYGITFPIFAKIDVKGENSHPLYKYLTHMESGIFGSSIKWNFTKFLINQQGIPVERYAPITKPKSIAEDIEALLE